MHITVKRGGIFIDRIFFEWDEFRFVCGALLSITKSSEVSVYVGSNIAIFRNKKYEVHIAIPSSYEELEWKIASIILKHILPGTRIPHIPLHTIIEVKKLSTGENIYFWTCEDCDRKATPKHFASEFICWDCYYKQKQETTT